MKLALHLILPATANGTGTDTQAIEMTLDLYFVWEGLLGKRSTLATSPKACKRWAWDWWWPRESAWKWSQPRGKQAYEKEQEMTEFWDQNMLESLDTALPLNISQQSRLCSQTSLSWSFRHLQPEESWLTKLCFRLLGGWALEQINIIFSSNSYNTLPIFFTWYASHTALRC